MKKELLLEKVLSDLVKLKDDKNEFRGKVLSLDSIDYTAFDTWEWPQGVALYGISQLYYSTKKGEYLEVLEKWFEKNYDPNTPKNINTFAPLHGIVTLYDVTKNEKYEKIIIEWINWVKYEMPRTSEGGFQHSVSERDNVEELWDDTLMMTVLPILRYAKIKGDVDLINECKYQFYLHAKYLFDKKSKLWFHGWCFNGSHNFAEALWCRGNAWIVLVIPEFIELFDDISFTKYAGEMINSMYKVLEKNWNENGLWNTLLDDEKSYFEMSGSCGIAAGLFKANSMGLINGLDMQKINNLILKIENDLEEKGYIDDVSYGTPMGKDLDFYRNIPITPMPYGHSLAMLLLIAVNEGEK